MLADQTNIGLALGLGGGLRGEKIIRSQYRRRCGICRIVWPPLAVRIVNRAAPVIACTSFGFMS